jgi:RES domain
VKQRDLLAAVADLDPIRLRGTFERRIVTCKVDVPGVLDLRPADARTAISLTDAQLFSDTGDYAACQAVGAAAHELGVAGLIAPAASRRGETLALFSANLPSECRPKVVKRDIWRGLPPDPRRLRLVDQA